MAASSRVSRIHDWLISLATDLRLQVLLVALNGSALGYLVYQGAIGEGKIFDPHPALEYMLPGPTQNLSDRPAVISTGLTVSAFPTFEITKNKFVIHAVVWFIYNPEQVSPDIIDQFSLIKGTIIKKSKAEMTIITETKIFAKYDIVADFSSDIDYRYFPLDNHTLYIIVTNLMLDRKIAVFNTENIAFNITDPTYIACASCAHDSLIKNLRAEYGYSKSQLIEHDDKTFVEHPTTIYAFSYMKPGIRSSLLIIIPILLMFFMALFPLSLDPSTHATQIIGISIGILTSILTYRFVIENLSPQIDYFCMSDYIYTVILGSVFFLFLFNTSAIRVTMFTPRLKLIRLALLFFFHGGILFFMYNILNNWI